MHENEQDELADFAAWVDNEGGIYSLWKHGLSLIDVPKSIQEDWLALSDLYEMAEPIEDRIKKAIRAY